MTEIGSLMVTFGLVTKLEVTIFYYFGGICSLTSIPIRIHGHSDQKVSKPHVFIFSITLHQIHANDVDNSVNTMSA